jgi:outer membrane protein assembly factor BamB
MNLLRHPWKLALLACFLLLVGGFLLVMSISSGPSNGGRRSLFSVIVGHLTGEDRRRALAERAAMAAEQELVAAEQQLVLARVWQEIRFAGNAPWPMFGGTPERNMANVVDKNIPTDWSIEEGKRKNIKWMAELGSYAYGGPVVAGGKVFVGTNNAAPRDPRNKGRDKAVLMAFNESDGKFLWQIVHDIPPLEILSQVMNLGLLSTPAVYGKHIYYVTPSCEVICAGIDAGKVEWRYDMMKELKVVPLHCGNCSPLVVGDRVYVVTSNGRDEADKVPSPNAPSFISLDKKTGKLAWQSNLPGENIIEGQWSNPTLATVSAKQQIIFPGGDSVIYSLEPDTGKLIWKFQCLAGQKKGNDPKARRNYPIGTPVVAGNRLYIGLGVYPEGPGAEPPFSHFLCLDITKTGDVSPASLDAPAAVNKNSALVWAYGGMVQPKPKKGRAVVFRSTLSTAAIHDGLAYISEDAGYLHCLDAQTGQKYWEHDFKAGVWGSPYYVDGKVYQGAQDGSIVIFEAAKKYKVIRQLDMEETIEGTPVVANGVLYIATKSKLYAIAEKK